MTNISSTPTAADTRTSNVAYTNEQRQTVPAKEGSKTENKDTAKQTKRDDVDVAVKDLNLTLDSLNVRREFRVDDSINDVVVKIIDKDDQKVIRQIPSEEAIKLSKNIREMVGILYDSTS